MPSANKSNMPGMVRMSFGCYNNTEDVDRLLDMVGRVARGDYQGNYQLDRRSGEFYPLNYADPLADHFLLEATA